MPTSKTIRQLEEQMTDLTPGSLRHQTLEAARRFKASWIELGQKLWTVWKEKAYRSWGYLTFEAYCAKELHLRSATAKKLLHSYYFLEKEEPSTLQRLRGEGASSTLPSPEAVNVLRLLKRREEVPSDHYQQVRQYVLEEGKDVSEVRQRVQEILKASRPESEEAQGQRRRATVRRMIGTLKALRREMEQGELVPRSLLVQVETLVKRLEAVL